MNDDDEVAGGLEPSGGGASRSGGSEREQALVDRCVAGDEAAWEEFIGSFTPLVMRTARLRLRRFGLDEGYSEDVTQQVFVKLVEASCRRLRGFDRRKGKLAPWLATVADRAARDHLEEQGREKARRAALEESLPAAIAPPTGERIETSELASLVGEALRSLPPREGLALRLFYEQELTYPEIASALGVTEGTVASTLSRARQAVRELVEGRGG